MTDWARYTEFPIDSFFHVIVSWNQGGSVVTACHGKWQADASYEVMASPPHGERCEACSRNWEIEIGLAELVKNAPGLSGVVEWDLSDAGAE